MKKFWVSEEQLDRIERNTSCQVIHAQLIIIKEKQIIEEKEEK